VKLPKAFSSLPRPSRLFKALPRPKGLGLPQVVRRTFEGRRERQVAALAVVLVLLGALFLGGAGFGGGRPPPGQGEGPRGPDVSWGPTVNLNAAGYEPGIASDSTGALYMTAHKNLDDKTTWPYLASWFLMSLDQGQSWVSPSEPRIRGNWWKTFLGDEGDIAVDAADNVYFVDTYLLDNHIHVFRDQGVWDHSVRIQKSTGLDDRPWIAGQANGVLHYLGNNGAEVAGGRYWYYRSENQGLTWTAGDPVPGNGWAHIDAERTGDHVYVVSESEVDAPADILVYVSENQGRTFDFSNPVVVAHRDGPGREYPVVTAGDNGLVYVLWNDASDGIENGTRLFVGVSDDFGKTWNTTEVTPFKGFLDYPTINAGPDGRLAVAFYGTTDLPVSGNSTWYLYAGMQRSALFGEVAMNFSIASEEPLYQGDDLHALHDFFEVVITPDGALNVAFQHYDGPCNGCSSLYFVRGELPETTRPQ